MANNFGPGSVGGQLKRVIIVAFVISAFVGLFGWKSGSGQQKQNLQQIRLGERLFAEQRFTTAKGDLATSCSGCHLLDEDPQGLRPLADFFNRSWVPYRTEDPRRTEIRNSPTLFDTALMTQLHFDGEFKSLEELVAATFSGRPMGWLPGEEEQAFNQLHAVLLEDRPGEGGASYREQFKAAFNVELDKLSRDQAIALVSKAVAEFVRTFNSKQNSSYDQFIKANGLDFAPAKGETGKAFGRRTLAKLSELETNNALKLTAGFNRQALDGYKTFLRGEGTTAAGNCVACHAPPLFTDFSFHNIGISQAEYDQLHGEGKFARLQVPDAAHALRPSEKFREMPERRKPGAADLGFWNFIDLKTSPLRRAGESDDELLSRMIGAFKTPSLRHLAYSYPYMHTGSYATVEDCVAELIRLSAMARAGQVRQADEELARIRISNADIAPLAAFLQTLNEPLKRATMSQYRDR